MSQTTLHIPVSKSLKEEATAMAKKLGFSSLTETIEVFLQKFTDRKINLKPEITEERLSPNAARRYDKMVRDVLSGRVKTKVAHSVEELMKQLTSGK